ncbi:MAG: phosphate transport regulator [Sulfolobaceae archaeon]|nr:phosphate transport regulator [Sulfolobaceae archaeon]
MSNRSIAIMTILENIEKISLDLIDESRIFHSLLDLIEEKKDEELNQLYQKINGLKNAIEDSKYKVEEYIYKIGEGILFRELYINTLNNLEKIAQNIDAAGYRIIALKINKELEISDEIKTNLKEISEKLIFALDKLNESLRNIVTNIELSNKKSIEIIKIEEDVDLAYREFEMKLFSSKNLSLLEVMLLKDVVDRLEDSVDLLKEIANNILYINLVR